MFLDHKNVVIDTNINEIFKFRFALNLAAMLNISEPSRVTIVHLADSDSAHSKYTKILGSFHFPPDYFGNSSFRKHYFRKSVLGIVDTEI